MGASISRFTCASDSSPLMASRLWPNAISTPSPPRMAGKCSSHPLLGSLSGLVLVLVNTGCSCGRCIGVCFTTSVIPLQARISTPITVVSCMIRSAFSLLSWTPTRLACQKYSVMPIAITTDSPSIRWPWWLASKWSGVPLDLVSSSSRSPNSPSRYLAADTLLIGPVST